MDNTHYISTELLSLETLAEIVSCDKSLALSEEAKINIQKCRDYLDKKMASHSDPIYGINTGFGSLCNVKISNDNLSKLQENLVKSHSCGTGEEVPTEIVKLMLLFKIQSLSYGHSGIQLQTVERLIAFYNNDILPVIYTQGSLGASGDLAPLAHLSLPLLGEGEVYFEGKKVHSSTIMKRFDWEPIVLQSKEGLALLNGTQFMSAYGAHILLKANKFSYLADLIGAISLEGFDGRIEPFNELIHFIRPHKGQIVTASRIKGFLDGSEIIEQPKVHVQDPYSFRCMPQVHGASKDAIDYAKKVFPGLNSGLMIPQYTAASIASQNKQLATPASIDSIVSSNGQEDHVSMGANAATKALRVLDNLERILAIELMNASQAIEYRRPLQSSDFIEMFLKAYREEVPFIKEDRILHYDIEKTVSFLNSFQIETDLLI